MICLKCGSDTFMKVDEGLKCKNCGYIIKN
jgi:DNA-directed RNA polymerase subunit RPC12/RpoP